MKQIIIFLAFFTAAITSFSQTIQTDVNTKEYYLTKSHHQRTIGWIMLGGGAALTGAGIAVGEAGTIDYALGSSSNGSAAGAVVAVLGVASVLGSIPVFISAAHNKHKAASVAFDMQKKPMLYTTGNRSVMFQPALTLKIHL